MADKAISSSHSHGRPFRAAGMAGPNSPMPIAAPTARPLIIAYSREIEAAASACRHIDGGLGWMLTMCRRVARRAAGTNGKTRARRAS